MHRWRRSRPGILVLVELTVVNKIVQGWSEKKSTWEGGGFCIKSTRTEM